MSSPAQARLPERGFRLVMREAQLADLIQISCQNGTRGTFEVRTEETAGRLYFEAGKLVHAECEDEVGLNAVVKLLQSQRGEATQIDAPPPETRTIDMGGDVLLLHATQQLDEGRKRARSEPTTTVVQRVGPESQSCSRDQSGLRPPPPRPRSASSRPPPLPGASSLPPPLPRASSRPRTLLPPMGSRPPPLPSSTSLTGTFAATTARPAAVTDPDVHVVRISRTGSCQQSTGGSDPALPDRVFFAARSLAGIGRALGLGSSRALHLRGDERGLIVVTGSSITGVEGRCEPLNALSKKLEVS